MLSDNRKQCHPWSPARLHFPLHFSSTLLSLKNLSVPSLTVRCMIPLNKTPLTAQQSMWPPISSAFSLSKNGAEELQGLLCQRWKKGLVCNLEQSVEEHWFSNKTGIVKHFLTISTSQWSKSVERFVQNKKTHVFFHVWRELSCLEKIICNTSLEPFSWLLCLIMLKGA